MYYLCNSDKGRSGQTVPLRPLSDAVMRFVEKRYSKKLPAPLGKIPCAWQKTTKPCRAHFPTRC
ncbi:MAG: hypothetical protein SOY99_08345 [Alloprevotella sp.]|nr:hypothetical protein [Alloprevotella sp.]